MANSFPLKRLLLDWHIPDFGEPVKIDVPAYLAAIDRMRPETVYLMSKSAFGCTYYDDRYGFHNKALEQDLFADLVAPLQKRGIEVIAYVNVTLNDAVAKQHPEWHQVAPDGEAVVKFQYRQMCMASPYRDLLLDMIEDLAAKYPVDGFWFDLTYMHEEGCFCRWCREGFQAEHGVELTPKVGDDPEMSWQFHAFRRGVRRRFIEDAMARARGIRPGARFGWNHSGDPLFSETELDRGADWSSVEFHPPHFARGGVNARYLGSLGRPFELMLPESEGSWGDWTVMTRMTMRTMAAIAAAHGGAPIVGHVPMPSGDFAGRLAPAVVGTIADAFGWLDRRRDLCAGARSVPVGACFHSIENWRAVLAAGGLDNRPHTYYAFRGAADALAESNVHFDVLNEESLGGLSRYEFFVLSDVQHVSDRTAEALREYVAGGGALIATGRTSLADRCGRPLADFSLGDLLGVQYLEDSPYSVTYLDELAAPLRAGLPEMPLLLKAASLSEIVPKRRSLRARTIGDTEVWARFADPCLEPDIPNGVHIYHQHSPPATKTDWPAIVHRRHGKGHVVYVAGPLGYALCYRASPWLRRLLTNLLFALGLPRRLRVEGPAGIETVLMEKDGRWLLHLIPRNTESPGCTQIAEDIKVHALRVTARKAGATRVMAHPGARPLSFRQEGDALVFEVPPFGEWTVVEIA